MLNDWPMLLSNFFNRDAFNEGNLNFYNQNQVTVPAVNIRESAEAYGIELIAPGFSKTDFRIEVDNNRLTVSAEKNTENQTRNDNYYRREFNCESIRRSFTLEEKVVDADRINAQYADGILRLYIPKKEEALPKPAKLIEIK